MRFKNELIAALLKEVDLFPLAFPGALASQDLSIETIYFGGGTPSLLSEEEIAIILNKIRSTFPVSDTAEITLEANPDDITADKLLAWKRTGINRLSIGIQSFREEDLRWMNRAHDAGQARNALLLALREFNNITIDLIYGTPGLTNEHWKQNVFAAIALGIPHLSCYALTVEPRTPLQKMISQHRSADVDPDVQSEQFLLLMQWLADAGYEHYEISNFAKPGFRSRHNSSYWQGKPYFGFGPSAHSFDGASRWWNIANNAQYRQSIEAGVIPFEREELTRVQRLNELIMISLRTAKGLDLSRMDASAGESIIQASKRYLERGLMIRDGNRLWLTREGKLVADGIAADLFFDQE